VTDQRGAPRRRVSLELPVEWLDKIDSLKAEWGLRTRGDIVERLLEELFGDGGSDALDPAATDSSRLDQSRPAQEEGLEAQGALVLFSHAASGELVCGFDHGEGDSPGEGGPAGQRSSGIDLPGFVRKQSAQLKRSLDPSSHTTSSDEPLPQLSSEVLRRALQQAKGHWQEIYGSEPGAAVLEAVMVWIAQDIWPQSDLSEGRPFTWSLASAVMERLTPGWQPGPASFERVMVMAGVLEDPFSAGTLEVRQPTLIRRFVQRFRRRKRGMSFETLAHTMTLHGALKLLNLPTAPGQRLTLEQIREAYRVLALQNHPDSGGCDQTMRRLNEAYQLLKELYRQH
jgi:hypothetical protein